MRSWWWCSRRDAAERGVVVWGGWGGGGGAGARKATCTSSACPPDRRCLGRRGSWLAPRRATTPSGSCSSAAGPTAHARRRRPCAARSSAHPSLCPRRTSPSRLRCRCARSHTRLSPPRSRPGSSPPSCCTCTRTSRSRFCPARRTTGRSSTRRRGSSAPAPAATSWSRAAGAGRAICRESSRRLRRCWSASLAPSFRQPGGGWAHTQAPSRNWRHHRRDTAPPVGAQLTPQPGAVGRADVEDVQQRPAWVRLERQQRKPSAPVRRAGRGVGAGPPPAALPRTAEPEGPRRSVAADVTGFSAAQYFWISAMLGRAQNLSIHVRLLWLLWLSMFINLVFCFLRCELARENRKTLGWEGF